MENINRITKVTFLGYADAKEEDEVYKSAYAVARECAKIGLIVVDGGGPGVMRAASAGAKSVGGRTIGITFYPTNIPVFEGRDEANVVDQLIVADNYLDRTLKLLEEGQVFVIFKGGTGTISEFGMAWGLARLYFGHHKPLILYGDFWEEIMAAFIKNMSIRPEEKLVYKIVSTPKQAIDAIADFEKLAKRTEHDHVNPLFEL
ncbi:MAG: LOG family protein [Candidatus Curtissbacteria bacterium]